MQEVHSRYNTTALLQARGSLQHLMQVATNLVQANAAAVVLVRDATSLVLQSTHPATLNATFRWQNDHRPYDVERSHVITKVADLELARAIRAMLGDYRTGFLVRVPILIEDTHTVALLLHSPDPQHPPERHVMAILKSMARAMARDARLVAHEVLPSREAATIPDTFEDAVHSVLTNTGLILLFSAGAELIAASRGFKAAFAAKSEKSDAYLKSLPCADSLQHLFGRVFETEVSSPEVEISLAIHDTKRAVLTRFNPVKPMDSNQMLVEMRMKPLGWDPVNAALPTARAESAIIAGTAESFLLDTLLHKRSIRSRKEKSFVTVRSWRSNLKKHQIAALRMVKSHDPHYLGEVAGNECAAELEQLVGLGTFRYIVPVPCGHSSPEQCLSSAIARAAGVRLNIPVVNAFAPLNQSGTSHPRTNIERPAMRVIQPVPGPAIIIDDVATSGAHLFEAASLMKQAGSNSFSIAWIGGEAP